MTTDELRRKDHDLGGNTQDLGLVGEHGGVRSCWYTFFTAGEQY